MSELVQVFTWLYAPKVSESPKSPNATQESNIVTTSLIFLCFNPLAPILKALLSGSFDFISLKPEPSSVLIEEVSVFLNLLELLFSVAVILRVPDFNLSR